MTTIAQQEARARVRMPGLARSVRRSLASIRLALGLILALAAVVFAGTLIDQAPLPVVSDPDAYAQWLDEATEKYGRWTGTLYRLQLFNVFHSIYFRGLLALLTVNILVCTAGRAGAIWNAVFHVRTRMPETYLSRSHLRARLETGLTAEEAAVRIHKALSQARYRVTAERETGSVAVFGDKNRLSRFGTLFTHLSLILILVGAMAGGLWGFADPRFAVGEGSTRELGLGTGLAVHLDGFMDEYHTDGTPRDFRAEVTLLERGEPVKTGIIRINSPMRHKGIAFHQSFFGQAAVLTVRDGSGTVLFSDAVALAGTSGETGRPAGAFSLPAEGITVRVAGPSQAGPDPLVQPGEIRIDVFHGGVRAVAPQNLALGRPVVIGGLTFTFDREARFVGLNVVKDPGLTIIWVACALMVAGLVMLFYLPRRRLWALCIDPPGGPAEVIVGMPAQHGVSLEQEFERLQEKLARSLGAPVRQLETAGDRHG